ncbi:hypothetical protein N0V94_005926 [Neodidymelliopsis sp. IMI 364377]|nr:hypothetical protein N0V94_005926 [Neodidymelliopsis sp. IMI 364377]
MTGSMFNRSMINRAETSDDLASLRAQLSSALDVINVLQDNFALLQDNFASLQAEIAYLKANAGDTSTFSSNQLPLATTSAQTSSTPQDEERTSEFIIVHKLQSNTTGKNAGSELRGSALDTVITTPVENTKSPTHSANEPSTLSSKQRPGTSTVSIDAGTIQIPAWPIVIDSKVPIVCPEICFMFARHVRATSNTNPNYRVEGNIATTLACFGIIDWPATGFCQDSYCDGTRGGTVTSKWSEAPVNTTFTEQRHIFQPKPMSFNPSFFERTDTVKRLFGRSLHAALSLESSAEVKPADDDSIDKETPHSGEVPSPQPEASKSGESKEHLGAGNPDKATNSIKTARFDMCLQRLRKTRDELMRMSLELSRQVDTVMALVDDSNEPKE